MQGVKVLESGAFSATKPFAPADGPAVRPYLSILKICGKVTKKTVSPR
jgi:hypothetical protein